jgi:hypothetical protein
MYKKAMQDAQSILHHISSLNDDDVVVTLRLLSFSASIIKYLFGLLPLDN